MYMLCSAGEHFQMTASYSAFCSSICSIVSNNLTLLT